MLEMTDEKMETYRDVKNFTKYLKDMVLYSIFISVGVMGTIFVGLTLVESIGIKPYEKIIWDWGLLLLTIFIILYSKHQISLSFHKVQKIFHLIITDWYGLTGSILAFNQLKTTNVTPTEEEIEKIYRSVSTVSKGKE
jgi:hypothetical protein